MSYFPFFIDIKNRKSLVVGSGEIARHKIELLKDFEADITCISKEPLDLEGISFIQKEIDKDDIDAYFLVIAATENRQLNSNIGKWCREKNILVNVVDQKEDCTFIFPAIVKKEEITAAFSSGGENPLICSYLKKRYEEIIDEKILLANRKVSEKRKELMNIDYKSRKEILMKLLDEYLSE